MKEFARWSITSDRRLVVFGHAAIWRVYLGKEHAAPVLHIDTLLERQKSQVTPGAASRRVRGGIPLSACGGDFRPRDQDVAQGPCHDRTQGAHPAG